MIIFRSVFFTIRKIIILPREDDDVAAACSGATAPGRWDYRGGGKGRQNITDSECQLDIIFIKPPNQTLRLMEINLSSNRIKTEYLIFTEKP